ncbi:MAG: hypothetical protein ACTSSA_11925 [Candidatus Freyarchaeota archaeon]
MTKKRIKFNEIEKLGLPTFNPYAVYPYGLLGEDRKQPPSLFIRGHSVLRDWLGEQPYIKTHHWGDGEIEWHSLQIFLTDGRTWIEVPPQQDFSYSNCPGNNVFRDGKTVAEFIAELPEFHPRALLTCTRAYRPWRDENEGPNWSLYLLKVRGRARKGKVRQ